MSEGYNKSEVARLMQRIDEEYEAAWQSLHGFASGTARHDFINQKLENMAQCHEELKTLVGEQDATKILVEVTECVNKRQEQPV